MLLKDLEQHCGECAILDTCDVFTPAESNYNSLCYQEELRDLDDKKDKKKIEEWCEKNLKPFEEEEDE